MREEEETIGDINRRGRVMLPAGRGVGDLCTPVSPQPAVPFLIYGLFCIIRA